MSRRLSVSKQPSLLSGPGSGSGSGLPSLAPDKPYATTRLHYRQRSPAPAPSLVRRDQLYHKRRLVAIALCLFLFLFFAALRPKRPTVFLPLRDQPDYAHLITHKQCAAKLCNSAGSCHTWYPHGDDDESQHGVVDLQAHGIYRDVALISVDFGCELLAQMHDTTWMPIGPGETDCLVHHCRDMVDMDLKSDLYILASQIRQIAQNEPERELIVPYTGQAQSAEDDVTLVTQFSVNRLDTFARVIESWKGPIAIAVYLTEADDTIKLKNYFAQPGKLYLYARVNMVIVKPDYTSPEHLKYPINHLRNLAVRLATSSHIFVMDADFSPSANFYDHARTVLLPLMTPTTALVVPCFGLREGHTEMPQDRVALDGLLKHGTAYITDPGAGHGPTLATTMTTRSAFYEVCYESQWEPYYILRSDAPLYDARFKNQGGDKQSHALQLNAAGYRFLVSPDIFILHKDHAKMVWPGGGFNASQKAVTHWNYFEHFMLEMEDLYGSDVRWPRACSALAAVGWQDQRRDVTSIAL